MKARVLGLRGFTAIEAVILMVVLAILSVIAIPRIIDAVAALRIQAAAEKIATDIRYARRLALNRHTTYGIDVNLANNQYSIFSLSGSVKTTLTDPYRNAPFVTDFDTDPLYDGVTISSVDFCQGASCPITDLRIDAFGQPIDSSGAQMASAATLTLTNGALTRTIRVTQETGYTEIL